MPMVPCLLLSWLLVYPSCICYKIVFFIDHRLFIIIMVVVEDDEGRTMKVFPPITMSLMTMPKVSIYHEVYKKEYFHKKKDKEISIIWIYNTREDRKWLAATTTAEASIRIDAWMS